MLYSEKHKFVVVTPPKTGSHTLGKTLAPMKWLAHQHGTYSLVKKKFPEIYSDIVENFKKFFVVRNPWEHAVSSYFHKIENYKFSIEVRNDFEIDWYETFESYLKNDLYVPQSKFTFDDPLFLYDDVILFENLDSEIERICDEFGIVFESAHEMNGKNRENYFGHKYPENYQDIYTPELVELVTNKSQKEIKQFNYKF